MSLFSTSKANSLFHHLIMRELRVLRGFSCFGRVLVRFVIGLVVRLRAWRGCRLDSIMTDFAFLGVLIDIFRLCLILLVWQSMERNHIVSHVSVQTFSETTFSNFIYCHLSKCGFKPFSFNNVFRDGPFSLSDGQILVYCHLNMFLRNKLPAESRFKLLPHEWFFPFIQHVKPFKHKSIKGSQNIFRDVLVHIESSS